MEVFFNELSCNPNAVDSDAAKVKIIHLLETLKALRNDGFNVMRVSENFYSLELAADYNFTHFFNDPTVSRDLKILFKGVTKNPYFKDSNSYEAEIFVLSDFTTKDENGFYTSPEGLATAYVFNSPVLSLTGNVHWQTDSIPLTITTKDDKENPTIVDIPNLYSVKNVAGTYFRTWLQFLVDGIQLDSDVNIEKVFPPERFSFDTRAIKELISWYYDDKRFIIRIKELINDISKNPYKGGKGHTESLGGADGKASKRIIKKDRVVYTYTKEKIIIHQCRGHYDDK